MPLNPASRQTPGTPVIVTLANGVRLLAIRLPHVQSASVGVFLRVGSRDETPRTSGIGHVLEHMAFKGTATRTVQAINLDAERLGADVNAYTSKDTTAYYMTGLGRHAGQFLEMTADIVLNSTFPEGELARELEVIRQEAIEYEEDPQESSSDLLDRAIWGGHPMGMPVIGTVENIERFTRTDLVGHVKSHYVAENTVVAAAGNFDVDAFLALGEALFAGMRSATTSAVPAAPPAPAPYVGHAMGQRFSQVSQVFLNLAYPVAGGGRAAPRAAPGGGGAPRGGGGGCGSRGGGSPRRRRRSCSAAACRPRSPTPSANAWAWPTRPSPARNMAMSGPTSSSMRSRRRTSSNS